MKFGLMYEIQIPEPHYPGIEQERYKQVLAQAELADEVGFDYFWTVEHHFLKEFSHCSAPEVLYGALSQRTKRIRIGHAVALLPSEYNHPVRVAERAAVLDILSDGRGKAMAARLDSGAILVAAPLSSQKHHPGYLAAPLGPGGPHQGQAGHALRPLGLRPGQAWTQGGFCPGCPRPGRRLPGRRSGSFGGTGDVQLSLRQAGDRSFRPVAPWRQCRPLAQ